MTLLEAALAYAARGIPIFPCHPVEKYPLTPKDKGADGKPIPGTGGFYKATIDPIVIKRWWAQRPDAAIGMPTGSRSGIDVLDIDCKNGKDGFAALKTSGINWTELSPIRVHSRSAGGHGYFRANGVASSIALSGVDVQSDGRYVILPPSPGYVWVGLGLLDTSLDRLPGWPDALKGLSVTKPNGVDKSERISGPPEAPIEDVAAALKVIKNEDLLWDEWNRIGMLVYRATDGMGLDEWEEWSAKSEKHDPEACEARWEHWTSSSPPTTGGAGTLFRLADEAAGGSHWRPSRSVAAREEFDWAGPEEEEFGYLSIQDWLNADLPEPERLLGWWLTTTSRALLVADTGLGKTNFGMQAGVNIAAGAGFLHWCGSGFPKRVLYIDGEMSRRLLKKRIRDAVERYGGLAPETFFAFSHESVEGFAPLNTPEGRACVERLIKKLGGVDLIIFDSVMCLTTGDMKDEESWQAVLPWARDLTRRSIGQIWVHHTGHDATRSYGTKTREWQLDTVIVLVEAERPDTDVSFTIGFRKARERTPETRSDFLAVDAALVDGAWEWTGEVPAKKTKASPLGEKFLDALRHATEGCGLPSCSLDAWRAECSTRGLIDLTNPGEARRSRSLFDKYKRELIAANQIACNGDCARIRNQTGAKDEFE